MSTVCPAQKSAANVAQTRKSKQPLLHNERGIGIAAFLGTPLAGGILFAHNFIKLSRFVEAALVIVLSGFATTCLVALGMMLPESVKLGVVVPLAAAMVMQKISTNVFKAEFVRVNSGEVKSHSVWIGVLTGLAVAAAVIALILITF